MQALQPRVSGTRDYVGHDATALRAARAAIEGVLNSYAYASVDPPILEQSAPFLDRSGEDIRRHMYIFADPGGREICLRPEMTIPACRVYLRQSQASGALAAPEARLSYVGPVFRHEPAGEGQYRESYQAGAELIGAANHDAADAEILALAVEAVESAGLGAPRVEVGDLGILHAFIDGLPLADRPKSRLRRLALRNRKEARFLSAVAAREVVDATGGADLGDLAALLSSVEPDKAERLIRQILALADVRHVGGRTSEEIVERLMSRTAQRSAETISTELMQGIVTLLGIKAEPETAFERVRAHFGAFGIAGVEPVVERCRRRQSLFAAYRETPADMAFDVGLGRGLEYYTGFVFEIFSNDPSVAGHVCGGGRYDDLLEALGASAPIPAVGFGIGLDRLLVALQAAGAATAPGHVAPGALVTVGSASLEDAIRAGAALRKAGWSVELDTVARQTNEARARGVAYLVTVGEAGLTRDQVRIRRLADGVDHVVDLDALAAFVEGETSRSMRGDRT